MTTSRPMQHHHHHHGVRGDGDDDENEEDEFHLRLQRARSGGGGGSGGSVGGGGGGGSSGGGAFWRTNSNNATQSPAFNSMTLKRDAPAQLAQQQQPSQQQQPQATRTTTTTTALYHHHPGDDSWSLSSGRQTTLESVGSSNSSKPYHHHRQRWDSDGRSNSSVGSSVLGGGGGTTTTMTVTQQQQQQPPRRQDSAPSRWKRQESFDPNEAALLEAGQNSHSSLNYRTGGGDDHTTTSMTSALYDSVGSAAAGGTASGAFVMVEAPPAGTFADLMSHGGSGGGVMGMGTTTLDRSSSDQSTGSILYGKTPNPGAIMGKGTSLIFPTGVESTAADDRHRHKGASGGGGSGGGGGGGHHHYPSNHHHQHAHHSHGGSGSTGSSSRESTEEKQRKINLLLDQCESLRFPFKKKLMLSNLGMTTSDIPVHFLCGTSLGNVLHKLSMAGNPLGSIPEQLVQNLPTLKSLDLSQCRLHSLPSRWNLQQLKKLDLSNNLLRDFPEESMLEGLPELQELNMYGNKITVIVVPHDSGLLTKLEILDLGYNDISFLPEELDRIRSLRVLKIPNNVLTKIPMRICDMDLRSIDVRSNPVSVPPLETCERGIGSMKRYYQQLKQEEDQALRAARLRNNKKDANNNNGNNNNGNGNKKEAKKKGKYGGFIKSLSLAKSSPSGGHKKGAATTTTPTATTAAAAVPPPAPVPIPQQQQQQPQATKQQVPQSKVTQPTATTVPATAAAAAVAEPVPETTLLDKPPLVEQTSDEPDLEALKRLQDVTVNDTLKVIFVGMAMVGKTSMIKRLIEGRHAIVPTYDERTVGVDIYPWDPKEDKRFEHIDSRIVFQDKELAEACGDKDVKFSVWDFAGQHVYHATHELFFSSGALYVLVWDMGANNKATLKRKSSLQAEEEEQGQFRLSYEDDDDDDDDDDPREAEQSGFRSEEDARRADRALERDIDEKVQFWVDCIQSSAPGAAILPVASFADSFSDDDGGQAEAKRRCNMLKDRLLRHEQQRIQGIERRLQEYQEQNRADDPAALRLRNLLCASSRPKLIFGDVMQPANGGDGSTTTTPAPAEESVIRVSGTEYFGFDLLTERIVNIATGRYHGRWKYPIFHGRVGARIPRIRLQVRDVVRNMRDRFKVVEWGYFVSQLKESFGLESVEDISDALHFLTSIGELSYFGGVMAWTHNKDMMYDNPRLGEDEEEMMMQSDMTMEGGSGKNMMMTMTGGGAGGHKNATPLNHNNTTTTTTATRGGSRMMDDEDDLDDDNAILSIDETSITAPGTEDGSVSTVEDFMASGLSQFVFLNPRWLVAAVACILRHDLDREIKDTRRLLEGKPALDRASSFNDASLNCPVITAEDALMLWQAKKITKKAAERAQAYSNNMTVTPFEFLQLLLIRFGVFVPIDLSIEKALLGGKEYAKLVDSIEESSTLSSPPPPPEVAVETTNEELALRAKFFFLPSLLGPGEPTESWTFKNTESWKTVLCHSVLFPDGVPPGMMERLTASVLSSVYAVANRQTDGTGNKTAAAAAATCEGRLTVREVLCWRTAFFLKLGTAVPGEVGDDGTQKESIVEIFCHLAERDSPLCVGSDYMAVGTRRIIVSGRGQIGDGGRKIWKGGYLLVCKCVTRVMEGYGGLEYEVQGFCPDCLAKKPVNEASWWEFTAIRSAVKNAEGSLRCHHHGHVVDTRFVAGPVDSLQKKKEVIPSPLEPDLVPVQEMLGAIVLVGLWDGNARKVIRAGSGVIVDKKRGLIVTAGHTLMNVWGDSKYPFGENYYGLPQGKVVIGVIPDNADTQSKKKGMAVFRYFAKIVAKDSSFDQGECHLDACVLRITTKMENDVDGNGEDCGDQPEILMLGNERAFYEEKLKVLKISEKCELEEQVRVIGFNQGGEGLLGPGESLNRFVDFARGYVCKKFVNAADDQEDNNSSTSTNSNNKALTMGKASRECFKPREEIAVICPTIGGHSGGPCVNQQGEVIGILSRADPADNQRCYLSPASEWKRLIKQAKKGL